MNLSSFLQLETHAKKKKQPRIHLARTAVPDGGVMDDGDKRPGCQGDGGCEMSHAGKAT